MKSLHTDLAGLCERLRQATQEIEAIKGEYAAYEDHDLIEVVDDPTEPAPICPSALESLRFACVALDDAVKNVSRLRAR